MSETPYHYCQPDYMLMDVFKVSADDIKLNRSRTVSPFQKQRLWYDRIPTLSGFIGSWLFVMVMYLAFYNEAPHSISTNILGGLMVITFVSMVMVIVRAFRMMAGLQAEVAAGIATREKRDGQYGGWFLYVDGRTFELKPAQYETLRDGMPLAVYYVDRRKRILSVERIVFDGVHG